jgi:hypothetical protein
MAKNQKSIRERYDEWCYRHIVWKYILDYAWTFFVCTVSAFVFAVGFKTFMDTRIRSELHALVEKLLKYNKPIIASDIDGWNAIELLVRSGLNYISSESFAPYNQMIVPLPPKNVRKVQDMKGYKS